MGESFNLVGLSAEVVLYTVPLVMVVEGTTVEVPLPVDAEVILVQDAPDAVTHEVPGMWTVM